MISRIECVAHVIKKKKKKIHGKASAESGGLRSVISCTVTLAFPHKGIVYLINPYAGLTRCSVLSALQILAQLILTTRL